jgi:magnesium transporter
MIEIYQRDSDGVIRRATDCEIALTQSGLVWIDLDDPDDVEEQRVESALGVDVLTDAERSAMEDSARFYEEDGALYLTTTLLGRRDDGPFISGPVTFILTANGTLVTVRHIRPRAFDIGEGRSSARIERAGGGGEVMIALIEGCVERLADVLQESTRNAHDLSARVFAETNVAPDLPSTLRSLGRIGTLTALSHDSLSTLQRAVAYAAQVPAQPHGLDMGKLVALGRDIEQLERAVEAFQAHLTFLQEATLGLVGAAQSNTLKALSLATIAFVPPTLISSIFGMNFEAMAWFKEPWGPWVGFALMITAPAALFGIAKWRRWF